MSLELSTLLLLNIRSLLRQEILNITDLKVSIITNHGSPQICINYILEGMIEFKCCLLLQCSRYSKVRFKYLETTSFLPKNSTVSYIGTTLINALYMIDHRSLQSLLSIPDPTIEK